MSAAIRVLAEYRARKQVKEQLQRYGIKPQRVSARDLSILSRLWLDIHRDELLADAKEMP